MLERRPSAGGRSSGGIMRGGKQFIASAGLGVLCVVLNGCVHYRAQPIVPNQSEAAFQQRSLDDPGLAAFVRSVRTAEGSNWPPRTLNLETATLIAAYFNPAISLARSRVGTAEAAIVTAGGRLNPTAAAAAGYETLSSSPVVLRFELSLPIETAHKRSYRILEAAKLADVARMEWKEASWQVYSQVRDAWMDYITAVENAEAIGRESQIQTEVVSLMQQRLSAGEISRPEWNQSRVAASRTAVDLNTIRGQVAQARLRLASAMGVPESTLDGLQFATTEYDSPQPIKQLRLGRVQKAGLLNRLDIQRSLLEYAAADARLHLEIARQYPDIQLNPGYDFDEGVHKFTFGPSFPLPVWNRNQGPIAEAEARRSQAKAQLIILQQKAISEMEQSLAQYRSAFLEFREADGRWSAIQKDRERSMLRAVQLGQDDRLSLDATRLQSVEAQQARLQALAKTRAAWSSLENAVQAPLDDVQWIVPQAKPENGRLPH